jgi:hypothetical protein
VSEVLILVDSRLDVKGEHLVLGGELGENLDRVLRSVEDLEDRRFEADVLVGVDLANVLD